MKKIGTVRKQVANKLGQDLLYKGGKGERKRGEKRGEEGIKNSMPQYDVMNMVSSHIMLMYVHYNISDVFNVVMMFINGL